MYQLQLRLFALLCDDCGEDLANVEVSLRSPYADTVLGQGSSDSTGNVLIRIDPAANGEALANNAPYNGELLIAQLTVTSVPGQKANASQEVVIVPIDPFQPEWHESEEGLVAEHRIVVPAKQWCPIRARFGAWVICGRVVTENGGEGVAGVMVEAFDTDLFQDDALGMSAPSDRDGHFRIDYRTEDFRRTTFSPLINVELFPGPDLYFRASAGGAVLLQEDRTLGRRKDRGNTGPCHCVTLRVPNQAPPQEPDLTTLPYWTGIGDFNRLTDIDPNTGRTLGTPPALMGGVHRSDLAFTQKLTFRGMVPWRMPGSSTERLKYRFYVQEKVANASRQYITGDLIGDIVVGYRPLLWKWKKGNNSLSHQPAPIRLGPTTSSPIPPSPSSPDPWPTNPFYTVAVDSNGWVEVSPEAVSGVFGTGDGVMGLETNKLAPGKTPASVVAGSPVPPAEQFVSRVYEVGFEVATVSTGTLLPQYSATLARLMVSNHGEARDVRIEELGPSGMGCMPLDNTLTVLHTVDHDRLDQWSLAISSAASASGFIPPTLPSGKTPRGSHGRTVLDISDWPRCSYLLTLSTRTGRTNGLVDDPDSTVKQITFCIDR